MALQIVMAVYQGERFLDRQIRSIADQLSEDVQLLIGDDHSSDSTPFIAERWAKAYPGKIIFFPFKDNVGPRKNFDRLLELTDAETVMLADQDDLWQPGKIGASMQKIRELEDEFGKETPCMVFCDPEVIDDTGRMLAPSWKELVGISKESYRLEALLCRHAYLGCTMTMNRALIDLAAPIPDEAGMHDYWISLAATVFGKIGEAAGPLLSYRVHGKNFVGARSYDKAWFMHEWKKNPQFIIHTQQRIVRSYGRAFIFFHRYRSMMDDRTKQIFQDFLELQQLPYIQEVYSRIKHGFLEQTFWQNTALFYAAKKMERSRSFSL